MESTPLGSYEKEYMKMAMLKHEQTFKQQVYELHRLYRIQKILMKSIGSSSVNAFAVNNNNYSSSCCMDNKAVAILNYMKLQQQEMMMRPLPAEEEFVEAAAADAINEEEEEEERQVDLTLGLGLGPPTTSGSSSFSSTGSSSTRSFYQCSDHTQRQHLNKFPNDDVEAAGDRETEMKQQQYPPWIFQVLTLNST